MARRRGMRAGAISFAFVVAIGVLLPAVPGAAAAPVVTLHCGDTITTSVKLTSDLTNCTGNGLIVGADNIEIDLNGHSITAAPHGGLLCFGGPGGACFGIDTNGHSGMTIHSGRISNFDTNIGWIAPEASSRVVVYGIATANSTSGDIRVGDDSLLAFNRFSGFVSVQSRSAAVFNSGGPDSELIAFNGNHDRFERNAVPNILLMFATDSYVGQNLINGSLGIVLASRSDANVVTRNILLRSHISVAGSADNLISDNLIVGTPPVVNGIFVGFDQGISDHDTIGHNFVFRAANDGIVVEESFGGGHIDVRDNVTNFNGHDGIENSDVSTTLTANVANHNGNLGIESVPGAIDGGGNRASGNGNPAQCTNISCT